MNRNNRRLTLAAFFGIFLFALTGGVALAENPIFYVKLDNKTDNAIKIEWNFSTRAGKNATESKKFTIPPHTTQRFSGPNGNGKMNVWMHTGGEGGIKKHYDLIAEDNPQAPNAIYFIRYNNDGHLRISKPNE